MKKHLCIYCGKPTKNAQATASIPKDKCDDEILKNAVCVDENQAWFAVCRKCETNLLR